MKKLLIVCAGNFAREVYWHAQNSKGFNNDFIIKGFLEGNIPLKSDYSLLPMPVIDNVLNYAPAIDDVFVIANADANIKETLANILVSKGAQFTNLIHNTAQIAENAKIGVDVIISPFCMVSVNTIIGSHVTINSFNSIGHDAIIGDYTSLMSHVDITGNVEVGTHTYWGSGSRALPESKIGNHAKIGAGSLVIRKVKEGQTVFGIPALPI